MHEVAPWEVRQQRAIRASTIYLQNEVNAASLPHCGGFKDKSIRSIDI